jgi:hypothetical protein
LFFWFLFFPHWSQAKNGAGLRSPPHVAGPCDICGRPEIVWDSRPEASCAEPTTATAYR